MVAGVPNCLKPEGAVSLQWRVQIWYRDQVQANHNSLATAGLRTCKLDKLPPVCRLLMN